MPSRRTARTLMPFLSIPLIAGGSSAQPIPEPGTLLVSAIDSQSGLPDIFSISTTGLIGESGFVSSRLSTTVELSPVTPITEYGLEFVVLDNGSGMLRFTYFGDGAIEGGPVYTSQINADLGFDSYDNPVIAFEDPSFGFDNPIVSFTPGMIGLQHPMRANMPDFFEDPSFGFEDPSFGFEDPSFGFEDPSFGFTANSAIISYPTLDQEHELAIASATVAAGLAYPRAWFIDPNELNGFDGIDGESYTNYAGFAVFSYDAPGGPGMYLAPLDRVSIENQLLELEPFAVNGVFAGPFSVEGMHVDPVIPGTTYVWGSDGASRGVATPQPIIYRVDSLGTVTELTRGGELQAIDDLIIALDGTIYVLDGTTAAGKIVEIDPVTGVQTVLATGGAVFNAASSLSIVQERSRIIELNSTTDLADPNPGDGDYLNPGFLLTLRAVIEEANAQGVPHTIVLPAGTYDISTLGEISIQTTITLVGDGSDTTTITGANTSRVFNVGPAAMLKARGLTIERGRANSGNGGNILASGPVALESVAIKSGFASDHGGGIYTTAPLHVYKSHFTGNQANDDGGAIHTSNTNATIKRSSFFENEALNGGGIFVENAAVDMINTTFYLNLSFWEGGAIRTQSNQPVRLLHCTLLENEAGVFPNNDSAGGIDATGSSVQPIIKSCVLAYNGFDGGLADAMGSFAVADHSLFTTMDGASFGSLVNVMAGDNPEFLGTPVQLDVSYAFPMQSTSPIIDAAATNEYPSFDQLGYNRLIDGDGDTIAAPDMGAYEHEDPCIADLNDDGDLDFLDISDFLSSYAAHDPRVDFNTDGAFDFLDISLFLSVYTSGCP